MSSDDVGASTSAPQQMPVANTSHVLARVTLSNGAVVELRRPNGRTMVRANKMAEGQGDAAVGFYMLCQVGWLNGRRLNFEELEAAPLDDVQKLLAAMGAEGNSSTFVPATSSDSGG